MLVSVRNNLHCPKILSGEATTLPSKEWVQIPYEVAIRFKRDPDISFDWSSIADQALDWEGTTRHLSFCSPVNPNEGYGLMGCLAVEALEERGIRVHFDRTSSPYRDVVAKGHPKILEVMARPATITRWGIAHTWPLEFDILTSSRRIGWTMWEARRLPRPWAVHMDKIERMIVPSHGQVEVFRNSGFEKPIHVVPDGVEFGAFTPIDRPERDTFTFICWGRLTSRKCPIDLIECFWRGFEGKKDVRLVLKTREGTLGGGTFGIPRIDDERITVFDADWPLSRVVQMCHEADCAVFLSHGEGFGQPAVQAMGTGLPVILSNHSGQSDFSDARYNYPVGLDPKTPYTPTTLGSETGDQLEWWEPDYEQAIELMRHVYEHRAEARRKGKLAASWVRKHFSLEVMGDKLTALVRSLD